MIVHRYLLRELLVPFGAGLLLLMQVLFAAQLLQLDDLVFGAGAGASDAGLIALYLLPHFLVTAAPVALLLGIMIGLGRLAEDGEVVALAATGRSPLQLYAMPVALALALGAGMAWVDGQISPLGVRALRAHLNEAIKRTVAGEVRAGEFYEGFRRFTLFAGEVDRDRGEWRRVLLHDARGDGAPLLALAEAGRLDAGAPGEVMQLELRNGEIHRLERGQGSAATPERGPGSSAQLEGDSYTVARFAEGEIALGIADHQTRKNPFVRPLQEMTSAELLAAADYWKALAPAFSRRLLHAYHRKRAVAADAFIFALIGVPLAIGGGGRGRAFLLTLAGFAAFTVAGRVAEALGEADVIAPALAAWVASALFAALGLLLYLRLALGRTRLRRA